MPKVKGCEVCGQMTGIKVNHHILCSQHAADVSTAMNIAAMDKIKQLIRGE